MSAVVRAIVTQYPKISRDNSGMQKKDMINPHPRSQSAQEKK